MAKRNGQIDFQELNATLAANALSLVSAWSPGGRVKGDEYRASSIEGGNGTSFHVKLSTGEFIDHADPDNVKGGDFIAFYAKRFNKAQIEAARELFEMYQPGHFEVIQPKSKPKPSIKTGIIPEELLQADLSAPGMGGAKSRHIYRNSQGQAVFIVARYEKPQGGKDVRPWSYCTENKRLIMALPPSPRPLYDLPGLLSCNPEKIVLIVEGEKCVDAARKICGDKVFVTTFQGGVGGVRHTDYKPLSGRDVLLFPDDDNNNQGLKAMQYIADTICESVKRVRIITPEGKGGGSDIVDYNFQTFEEFKAWATPRIQECKPEGATNDNNRETTEVTKGEQTLVEQNKAVNKKITNEQRWELKQRDFQEEIGEREYEGFSIAEAFASFEPMLTPKKGLLIQNHYNAVGVLTWLYKTLRPFWYDEGWDKVFKAGPNGEPVPFTEEDYGYFQAILQKHFMMPTIAKTPVKEALNQVLRANKEFGLRDWLLGIKWDGTPRITQFLWQTCGVECREIFLKMSRSFWIGLVGRILNPGFKFDTMLILVGPQGCGKTTLFNEIGGEYYSECHTRVEDQSEFVRSIQGYMIVEMGELESMRKSEAEQIKAMLSRKVDSHRPLYSSHYREMPRRCVMVGTTNNDKFLKDTTGNRRFWCVQVTKQIDLEYVRLNREQLFAEAVVALNAGEKCWDMDQAELEEINEERIMLDTWEEPIARWCESNPHGAITATEICRDILKMEIANAAGHHSQRIVKIMQRLGWKTGGKKEFYNGSRTMVYRKK